MQATSHRQPRDTPSPCPPACPLYLQASQALGCGQELSTVQLMMAHAAEHVLG